MRREWQMSKKSKNRYISHNDLDRADKPNQDGSVASAESAGPAGAESSVASALEEKTGISMGETTEDGSIALRYVECLGQCQDGPSLVVNGVYYKHVTPDQIDGILSALH